LTYTNLDQTVEVFESAISDLNLTSKQLVLKCFQVFLIMIEIIQEYN